MTDAADSLTLRAQLDRACADLRRRLRCGEECRAEDYFAACPPLADSEEHAVELIVTEYVVRRQLGQVPDPDEWLARFPRWRERLTRAVEAGDIDLTATEAAVTEKATSGAPPAEGPAPGAVFAGYELLDRLGKGGMGVVYRAWDPRLTRTVALKMIRDGALAGEADLARFEREVQAVAQFNHPHIVRLYEYDQHLGYHYYTMDLAPGGNLGRHKERFRDPRAAAALVEKVARAVHHAHEKGVVHRDLKPGNILLGEDGEPVVSDFGLAKLTGADAELTRTGQHLGTAAYMAPEQAAGRAHEATARTDVWSLGVILYELLLGRRPFEADDPGAQERLILTADPPRPRALCPALDRELETIVLTCLAKEPRHRYASAAALADDLGRWLRREPIVARPEGWVRRGWRAARRHPTLAGAAALLAALALGAALAAPALRPSAPPGKPAPREPIDLLADGRAEGWRVVLGDAKVTRSEGGALRVEPAGTTPALVQLIDAPPWDRFRLLADVEDLGPASEGVGVFFAHAEHPTALGAEHWFVEWSFVERDAHLPRPGDKTPQARAHVVARRYAEGLRDVGRADHWMPAALDRYAAFFPARPGRPRTFRLEVTPEQVSAFWDGEPLPLATAHRSVMARTGKDLAAAEPAWAGAAPDFSPAGGLGVMCERGAALVRRAVLEPLPAER